MAINNNHTAEDLNEIKCAIVEKNVSKERADYLKSILEYNKFTVIIVPSPPAKAPKVAATITAVPEGEAIPIVEAPAPPPAEPTTFTIGVTDVRFNTINAIFGRLLKTPDKHIVTLAYWNQEEKVSNDEVPYFEKA